MLRWLFPRGGNVEAKDDTPAPEPLRRYTAGFCCGQHSSPDHNGGICAECGGGVQPAVIRQWWLNGFGGFGTPYIPGKWYGAEFVRWIDSPPTGDTNG